MLKLGQANVEAAGFADRIKLEQVDAKMLPYPDGRFAAVISNSIVHHIPAPPAAFADIVRVCRRAGLLFIRDLMRPPDMATLEKLVEIHAVGANDHQRQMFADSLHAALTLEEVRDIVAGLGFDPTTVQATSDRHWTWAAVR
jgi:ubiquinone/menaquinone biosynthesis C-methylase UbiE